MFVRTLTYLLSFLCLGLALWMLAALCLEPHHGLGYSLNLLLALGVAFSAAWNLEWAWGDALYERRVRQGRCRQCGYDLRASPERCPECGTASAPAMEAGRIQEPPSGQG